MTKKAVPVWSPVNSAAQRTPRDFERVDAPAPDAAEGERWYRSLIENASDLVLVLDAYGVARYVSPGSRAMLGREPAALVGTRMFDLVHPEDIRIVELEFARLLDMRGPWTPLEFRCRHTDGGWRTIIANARNLLLDPTVQGLVVNARDITEQRSLERQLQHAQKMEAVGRLAGGVAHDFSNLLSVIRANVQVALRSIARYAPGYSELEGIGLATDRATVLTRQLLTFSRQQPLTLTDVRCNEVIEGIQHLLERLVGDDVVLALSLDASTGVVHADRGQLEHVLMNLAVNARDAMPNGGRLDVATFDAEVKRELARLHPGILPGDFVCITVSDTGSGMTPEVKARIFEPFFSTKERGKGTGLGLSTVYGIVRQCGGFLMVDSEPGSGTTVRLYLPRID